LPAVVSVPPFQGDTCSTAQACFCATGSQAIRRPKGLLLGGSALMNMAVFQPSAAWGRAGMFSLNFQALSSIRLNGMFCAGR
jgi:hypothetical protein